VNREDYTEDRHRPPKAGDGFGSSVSTATRRDWLNQVSPCATQKSRTFGKNPHNGRRNCVFSFSLHLVSHRATPCG